MNSKSTRKSRQDWLQKKVIREKETQTSKTILQLAQQELDHTLPKADDISLKSTLTVEENVDGADALLHHFERKSDIFYSSLNMPALEQEVKTRGLSLTRLFLSKKTLDPVEKDHPNYSNFQVASTVDQKELASNESSNEEVFRVPQWSRFSIREIRVKSIDAANNLLIQDYKKTKSTGSVPDSIHIDEDQIECRSQHSTARRVRSHSPETLRSASYSQGQSSPDTASIDSVKSQKYKDTFHLLMNTVKSKEWSISLKALVEITEQSKSFDRQRILTHMTEINQRLLEFLRSPRSQVCRTACQIAGKLFENVKDTRRPDFDDLVEVLLMKTADSNKFIRRDANIALDSMIMNISHFHTIRAISQKGPTHKNDLVRISSARLYVCIVGITGIHIIMNHSGNDSTRQRLFMHLPNFIKDKNLKARSNVVMAIDPLKKPELHPRSHYGLYPYFLQMRQDLYISNIILKKRRKEAITALYEEDMRRDDEELRMIGRSYMINQR